MHFKTWKEVADVELKFVREHYIKNPCEWWRMFSLSPDGKVCQEDAIAFVFKNMREITQTFERFRHHLTACEAEIFDRMVGETLDYAIDTCLKTCGERMDTEFMAWLLEQKKRYGLNAEDMTL